jgi:hypothetical protein
MSERTDTRHSHISIGLRVKVEEAWQPLRALGWNPQGFNCYTEFELRNTVLDLKRATTSFAGVVSWTSSTDDDDVVLAAVLNEMLFKQAQNIANEDALRARLFKLLRAPWLTAEKRKVLASLGVNPSDTELEALVAQRNLVRPLFHYGVKVDSDVWRAAVQDALQVSSVVLSLEKLTAGFGNGP